MSTELGAFDREPDTITVSSETARDTRVISGEVGAANGDVVRLAGAGEVVWEGAMAPGAELTGGTGSNRLSHTVTGEVSVDLAAGTVASGGQVVLRWTGFESYALFGGSFAAVPALDVQGSPGNDHVEVGLLRSSSMPLTVDLGAGDDVLGTTVVGGPGSFRTGGPGRDRIEVAAPGRVELDMAARGLQATHHGSTDRAEVRSFQDAQLWGRIVRIVGDRLDNRLWAGGCQRSTVRGAKGADTIRLRRGVPTGARQCSGSRATVRFLGSQGHDTLVGGPHRDSLIGGAGRDLVRGKAGRDICSAERTRSCEVSR